MKKLAIALVVASLLWITGCNAEGENIKDNVDVEDLKETAKEKAAEIVRNRLDESEQMEILKEYYSFIEKRMDEDKIINFLKDNVEDLDEFRVDEMLLQLENHLYAKGYDTKGVLQKLAPHLQYASDEFKSYFQIWNREVQEETTDGEIINVPADEILDRAMDIEGHIEKFPEGKTRSRLEELYKTYMSMGIQGLGNQYIYAEDGESVLRDDVLKIYEEIISGDPDTRTSRILQNYLDELKKDNMELNGENALYFYDNMERIIENIN